MPDIIRATTEPLAFAAVCEGVEKIQSAAWQDLRFKTETVAFETITRIEPSVFTEGGVVLESYNCNGATRASHGQKDWKPGNVVDFHRAAPAANFRIWFSDQEDVCKYAGSGEFVLWSLHRGKATVETKTSVSADSVRWDLIREFYREVLGPAEIPFAVPGDANSSIAASDASEEGERHEDEQYVKIAVPLKIAAEESLRRFERAIARVYTAPSWKVIVDEGWGKVTPQTIVQDFAHTELVLECAVEWSYGYNLSATSIEGCRTLQSLAPDQEFFARLGDVQIPGKAGVAALWLAHADGLWRLGLKGDLSGSLATASAAIGHPLRTSEY